MEQFLHLNEAAPPSRLPILVFWFVALIVCVVGVLMVPTGLGLIVGYQDLTAQSHEAAITHFNRGLGYLAENYPELARAEFEIALKYNKDFQPAQQKLRDLQPKTNGVGGSSDDRVAATLFDEATSLLKQQEWSDAITRLEQLRTLKPDYRAVEVSNLTFQAYVGGGKAAVAAGQIELARGRFESALTIRNDAEVARQRDLAALYLDGRQAIGRVAVQKFAALYQLDPNYADIKKRLFDAYVQLGDLYAKQNAPCPAADQYDAAMTLVSDPQLPEKRNQQKALCLKAITTPKQSPTPSAAENYNWNVSTASDKPCTGTGDVTGMVRDALGRFLPDVNLGYVSNGGNLLVTKTNANGQYQFNLGKDPTVIKLSILGADAKTPTSLTAEVPYPGGGAGCHLVVDWQRVQ